MTFQVSDLSKHQATLPRKQISETAGWLILGLKGDVRYFV